MTPKTRYARSGNLHIAYQVVGDGPFDLLYVPGWVSHVELAWEEPTQARYLERLASFSRLILFDKRGTGLSDRIPDSELPTLEERIDDLRAVMDAAGSERAALHGFSEGGNMSALFAATHPERTRALVMFGVFAKRIWSADYPWAPTPEERERECETVEREWGNLMDLSRLLPSKMGDIEFAKRHAKYFRHAASPGAAVALLRMNTADRYPRHLADDTRPRHSSCIAPTTWNRKLPKPGISPSKSPERGLLSCPGPITCPGSATRMRSWTKYRNS